jgi:hypothetical protein
MYQEDGRRFYVDYANWTFSLSTVSDGRNKLRDERDSHIRFDEDSGVSGMWRRVGL